MATKLSRRKIADYVVGTILDGGNLDRVTKQLAGYLLESRRVNELDHIVRDIEFALSTRGHLVARVVSARKLSKETAKAIENMLKSSNSAKHVYAKYDIDESLIAGVKIEIPDKRIDKSVSRKLSILRTSQTN